MSEIETPVEMILLLTVILLERDLGRMVLERRPKRPLNRGNAAVEVCQWLLAVDC